MIRCVVQGCPGSLGEERTADGESRYVCDRCGAGPSGAAKTEIAEALRRIEEIRAELRDLERRLGRDPGGREGAPGE